jgi:WD40 repeat protein
VVYFSKLERLFVLLEGGEIWIFRTDQNPCTIVDIWNSDESSNYIMILESEGCILITICNALLDQEALSFCPPQLKGFAILLGATRNGHILVFGRGGLILDRYQLHFGCITQMVFDEQNSCLITAGLDDNIRISTIKPLHPNIIQIKIEIRTNFIPRLLVPMGNIIAVTSDDASIHMFEFNLARQEWKIMKGHQKMHDHTQRVNSLVCCKKMRIFVSSSLDNSVRIWNHQNKLIR